MSDAYIDPNQVYSEELTHWQEYWDSDLSLYENVFKLASKAVILPNHAVQLPIAVTYILIPSKWAKVLPILFSWGDKGTGKSTFAILASKIHGQSQVFSAADTFASIRNALDKMRWIDPETKQFEKDGVILCWDNLHRETLIRDPRIYQMLLFGYNRNSDRILVASTDGTNREYQVFCPKVISSVDELHLDPEFFELHRRLLPIRHKQFEVFLPDEKNGLGNWNLATDRLELDSIDWEGVEDNFFAFWNDIDRCRQYVRYRSTLTRNGKKPFTVPDVFTGEKWTVSVDLICTGLVLGTWQTIQQAIDAVALYWNWISTLSDEYGSNTKRLLNELIDQHLGSTRELQQIQRSHGFRTEPLTISAEKVKMFLDEQQRKGTLDVTPKNHVVTKIMRQLGWKRKGYYWEEIN